MTQRHGLVAVIIEWLLLLVARQRLRLTTGQVRPWRVLGGQGQWRSSRERRDVTEAGHEVVVLQRGAPVVTSQGTLGQGFVVPLRRVTGRRGVPGKTEDRRRGSRWFIRIRERGGQTAGGCGGRHGSGGGLSWVVSKGRSFGVHLRELLEGTRRERWGTG